MFPFVLRANTGREARFLAPDLATLTEELVAACHFLGPVQRLALFVESWRQGRVVEVCLVKDMLPQPDVLERAACVHGVEWLETAERLRRTATPAT